jgi:Fe-S-cluster containining protein
VKKPEILKKPVHHILVKPTHLQKMVKEGRLPEALVDKQVPLPQEPKPSKKPKKRLQVLQQAKKQRLNMPSAREMRKQQQVRLRLSTIHNSIPPLDGDLTPPCDECKTSACCYAFIVGITEMEYESGLYGDFAIKIDEDTLKQLRGKVLLPTTMNGPNPFSKKDQYVLEGMIGSPCPFLQEDGRCGVYDTRPITCRTYTCVVDDRITQGMRDGTEPILSISERMFKDDK